MSLRIAQKFLNEVVKASVEQALEFSRLEDEAEREKIKQANLEDRIAATVGHGEDKHTSVKAEEDPATVGGPTRGQALDIPGRDQPPEKQQASAGQSGEKHQAQEIDADAIIDKFNIIRSGRSMNDRDISSSMTALINKLTPEQRSGIFTMLSNIGKLVAPAVDSSRLTKPPEEPSAVQNARLQMLQKRRQDREQAAEKRAEDVSSSVAEKPAPERAPGSVPEPEPRHREEEEEDVYGTEDTSPPIRVGKRTAESIRVKMKQLLQD